MQYSVMLMYCLMKAEALWRKSGSATDAGALALVNQIRDTCRFDRSYFT